MPFFSFQDAAGKGRPAHSPGSRHHRHQTQLIGRQIQMVILAFVNFMGGLMACVFTVLPFGIWFGATVAAGGIVCSAMTYWSAVASGDGMWTLYYGIIAWGVVQMLVGWVKRRRQSNAATVSPESRVRSGN
jgi:hypothetical protein